MDGYAAAASNGNGTFNSLGSGSVYTGQGYFQLPETNALSKLATSLILISNRQGSISNALFVINGFLPPRMIYLPTLMK